MRDEDHAHALAGEAAQDCEEPVAGGHVERRGGLVEDQDARLADQRAGDAARLAVRQGQRLRREVERGRGAEQVGEDGAGALALDRGGGAIAEQPVSAHPHVLEHRARLDHEHLLEHRGDAGARGLPGAPQMIDLRTADRDLPAIRTVHAGEQLDERALARAVLADDRVDLTRADLDGGGAEGLRGAEGLGGVGHTESYLRFRHGRAICVGGTFRRRLKQQDFSSSEGPGGPYRPG